MKLKTKGFTLAELLVAIALFVVFLGGTAKFVIDALDSQDMDRRTRKAQSVTRTLLENMINDMRTAAIFPSNVAVGSSALPCGILYPDSAGAVGSRYNVKKTENKLILLHNDATDLHNLQASDYSAVLYCVIKNNRVLRLSRKLGSWNAVATPPSLTCDYWQILPLNSLIVASTGLTTYSEASLSSAYSSDNSYTNYGVARLDGPNDHINFWVGHSRFQNPYPNGALVTDNSSGETKYYGEKRYNTYYDRKLFNVKVVATVFYKGTSGGSITSETKFNETDGMWPPKNPEFSNKNARYNQVESSGSVRIQSSLD